MSLFLIQTMCWLASLIVLGASAGTDLKDRIIPNELVAALAAIGLAQGLASRPGLVWLSLLVAVGVFCGLGIFAHYKIIGGGDLKLMSAVTLLVPPDRVGLLLIEIALAGGLLSCFYLAARCWLKSQSAVAKAAPSEGGFVRMIRMERARIAAGESMPYALAVFGGVGIYIARGLSQCFYATSCSQ
jgi:prepilin peptidase CpaA